MNDAFALLAFWWDAGPTRWFDGGAEFDGACAAHLALHERAAAGELDDWASEPATALARVILLDQLPRNMFRGTARAFATDALALEAARDIVDRGFDRAFPVEARQFCYLPFQHAENLAAQETSLDLFRAMGDEHGYFYAFLHHDAIRRFGRFPHRNAVLGRETTAAEAAYLASGGFSG